MRKIARVTVRSLVAATLLTAVPSSAPAGPGDATPVGPLPQAQTFSPQYWKTGSSTCTIYVDSFYMPDGPTTYPYMEGYMLYWIGYSISELEGQPGWWEEQFTVDMTPFTWLRPGNVIWFTAQVMDNSTGLWYQASNSYTTCD